MVEQFLSDLLANLLAAGVLGFVMFGKGVLRSPRAYMRGWFSEDDGRTKDQNPYKEGTARHAAWKEGWEKSKETNP